MFPFCHPTFVRCLSGAGMPLQFFGKGLAQLCSPIAIAIARLVCASVFSCWIWLCLWRESIHFLASVLWVAAKQCPHLHYELWSSCCGLWILQQIVLGNGCRNDEPTSFHGLSLDSMELHQILARSQLWRLQKIHKRESFSDSLVEAYQSWPLCNAPTYWRYRKVVELWTLNFRIDVPSTSNTLWPFSTLSFSLPNASHCWRFNHRRPTHLGRSYTFHVFEKKVAKRKIAEWPFVDLQNEKTGENFHENETHGYHASIMKVCAHRQSKVFGGQDTFHVFRIGLLTVLEPLLKNLPVVLQRKKKTRECRPVRDVSPLMFKVSIETYKKYTCVCRYW